VLGSTLVRCSSQGRSRDWLGLALRFGGRQDSQMVDRGTCNCTCAYLESKRRASALRIRHPLRFPITGPARTHSHPPANERLTYGVDVGDFWDRFWSLRRWPRRSLGLNEVQSKRGEERIQPLWDLDALDSDALDGTGPDSMRKSFFVLQLIGHNNYRHNDFHFRLRLDRSRTLFGWHKQLL
jgi:hypothetical protein